MDLKIPPTTPRPSFPPSSDEKMDFNEDSSLEMEFDEDAVDFDGKCRLEYCRSYVGIIFRWLVSGRPSN